MAAMELQLTSAMVGEIERREERINRD